MKIALDITPLSSGHKIRGIGAYTHYLVEALKQYDRRNSYIFFTRGEKLPKDIDLIHYPYFEPFSLTLPWRKEVKTVVTVHDLIPLKFSDRFPKGFRGWVKYQIQKQLVKRADAIITDSECSKKDISQIIDYPQEKIMVIYLAPGPEFKKLEIGDWQLEIKQKYQLPDIFVLYVGDVTWNKNIPGLVSTIKQLNIPLVMVGKQTVEKEFDRRHRENQDLVSLEKEAAKDLRIIRLGFVPTKDLVAIYNLATVYCQPSFYEGFGLPVLEAMACGVPVVAANTSSLPEICDGVAIMINPHDTDSIANGIRQVIQDKTARDSLGQRGLIQVKRFSWQKVAQETIKTYETI